MYQLSPSKLNVLNECPRCFWNANIGKVTRPRGPFPTLPGGLDRRLKEYFDGYRQQGTLPPMLKDKLPGVLMPDISILERWRNWRTGLMYFDHVLQVKLIGALDDCLVEGGPKQPGIYTPIDYKSKGSRPKTSGVEYYQTQLDCYMLMLEENGYKTSGKGYLIYFWPEEIWDLIEATENKIVGHFGVEIFEIACDANRARDLIKKAVEVLTGEDPEPSPNCEYCNFARNWAESNG